LPDAEWLAQKKANFINARNEYGLATISSVDLEYEFQLQTVQRCLKAAGTFSYQSSVRGRTHFLPFIKPMICAALSASKEMGKFPMLQKVLEKEIASSW
jgi:hypothetical protein